MPVTVKLVPGGTTFEVAEHETVLAAALRQRIHLPCGCHGGSCAQCRARVVAGEVAYPDGPPLGLAAPDLSRGEALLCRAVPRSNLIIEAQEITAITGLRVRTLPCRVARLEQLAHDVMALYLQLPAVESLEFLPGQYLDVLLPDGHRRSFSIASPPHDSRLLELHVRHLPGGRFSEDVFHHMHQGALLEIQGPLGIFFLRRDSSRPVLMVAGGTGFAPFKSMLRHLLENAQPREVAFYWGVRARRDLYARAWLEARQHNHPALRFVPVLSEPMPEDGWSGRTGFVHEAALADSIELSAYDVYLAGPPAMVEAGRRALITGGADAGRLYHDPFDYAPEVLTARDESTAAS